MSNSARRKIVEMYKRIEELERQLAAQPGLAVAQRRDREADRSRFPDPLFNKWLDESISDAGHTVWDQIGDTAAAWAGWDNLPNYAKPVSAVNVPKQWPFVESPGEFAKRLQKAIDYFDSDLLAAVRHCLIENPPSHLSAAPAAPVESKDKQDAGWIRVNDLLPASKNDVLVYCMDTNEQFVAFHCGKGEFQFALDRHGERIVCRPTYWMPLPPAPIAATAQQKDDKGGETA